MGRGLQAAPGLVCFDLDGTLYHDDRIYLRMIDYYFAGTPWEKEIGSVKAEMSRVLAGGNPAFRCGRFAPKEWGVCPGPAAALRCLCGAFGTGARQSENVKKKST